MVDCIFCSIASGQIPTDLVAGTEGFIVIKDVHPQAPVHLLIVSREHIPSLDHIEPQHHALLGEMVAITRQLAEQFKLANGYKVVINCGPDGGQVIPHLHIHLLGGQKISRLV